MARMYDALTSTYTFACPRRGAAHVVLSRFRRLEQLPGAAHPAVFEVDFSCSCGDEHPGLVPHDDLDWAPLGLGGDVRFLNVMTSKLEPVGDELGDLAARRIESGAWPWSFYCYPEERPRPVFPSAFFLLAPAQRDDWVGVAVRCPACGNTSVNLVTRAHLDVPFHNDPNIGVVRHVFTQDAEAIAERFRDELHSSSFDARRLLID